MNSDNTTVSWIVGIIGILLVVAGVWWFAMGTKASSATDSTQGGVPTQTGTGADPNNDGMNAAGSGASGMSEDYGSSTPTD